MGTLVWSPLAKGMLTGRIRKGQETDLRRAPIFTSFSDEARLDAVEQIIPIAEEAGLPNDAPGHRLRDRPSRGHERDPRPANHGTAR